MLNWIRNFLLKFYRLIPKSWFRVQSLPSTPKPKEEKKCYATVKFKEKVQRDLIANKMKRKQFKGINLLTDFGNNCNLAIEGKLDDIKNFANNNSNLLEVEIPHVWNSKSNIDDCIK